MRDGLVDSARCSMWWVMRWAAEAGSDSSQRLGMAVSDDTILRLVKRGAGAVTSDEAVRVLGMDDWAWQKGQHHYGTILVDLERRRVVDVFPVCTADAVAAWLTAHPEITTISRDRHGPYAEAVRRGAPQATQVADCFHLVVNLGGAVERELSRLRHCLTVPHVAPPVPANANHHPIIGHRWRRSTVLTHQRRIAQERSVAQLELFAVVKRLRPPAGARRPSCARRGSAAPPCAGESA